MISAPNQRAMLKERAVPPVEETDNCPKGVIAT
eukprot:CAMPEP_0180577106 /NCGR_PEP_ID=MMETSP1037_2-20121125/11764_2 /TAXON_ID=632150 /ORGANISM="Azadinium spinosum, Strain 3D9" /LENGTH=32 /DNA_ID= /DNA_START= /DNA_END= /DNA_ORIENTATION=